MKYFALFFFLIVATQTCFAADSEIHLNDGSVISGNVLSFDGKTYRIKSNSLGVIELADSKIKLIRSGSANTSAAGKSTNSGINQSNVNAMQQQLMSNPDIMRSITSLQNDPQIQAMLNNPQVMQSIMAGDVDSLMNNPDFKSLMDNPTIRDILNKTQP